MCPFVRTMTSTVHKRAQQPGELLGHDGIMCRVKASNVGGYNWVMWVTVVLRVSHP